MGTSRDTREELNCKLCFTSVATAKISCGHDSYMCDSCAKTVWDETGSCPVCRCALEWMNIKPTLHFRKSLHEFKDDFEDHVQSGSSTDINLNVKVYNKYRL